MAQDARLRAVAGLAQAMAAAQRSGVVPGVTRGTGPGVEPGSGPGTPRRRREVVHAAAECAREALQGSFAAIAEWDRPRGRLRVLVNTGELAEGETAFPEDESYPAPGFAEHAWAAGTGEPRASVVTGEPAASASPSPAADPADADADADAGADVDEGRMAVLRRRGAGVADASAGSGVVATIAPHGRVWGELYVARGARTPAFTPADAEFAAVLASVIASGLAQSEQLEEARRLAYTDQLTGLANRRAVDARLAAGLERHRAEGAVVSLVVCDVNGLKRVNDELGHEAGDRLLERFGTVLALSCAALPGTLAARLGGDEFCLLSVGPGADEVVRAAEEVCRRAGELLAGEGVACGVASTGDPIGPVRSAARLFRLADAAQYRAKAARARRPVVAGGDAPSADPAADPVVRLADASEAPAARLAGDRRRFRGAPAPGTEGA